MCRSTKKITEYNNTEEQIEDDIFIISESAIKSFNKKIRVVLDTSVIVKWFFKDDEKNIFLDILLLIGDYVPRKNIIVLKGNHEKISKFAEFARENGNDDISKICEKLTLNAPENFIEACQLYWFSITDLLIFHLVQNVLS